MAPYDRGFYDDQMTGSFRSASVIVPMVLEHVPARTVCDIGCGTGTWLCVFMNNGVSDVLGVDGDYVPSDYLKIPRTSFYPADLRNTVTIERTFDLAVSLEVAEHLPASRAESFVATLTQLAPVVLFSAAIPNQGGTEHINEQWPDYWEALFAARGFVAVDAIRPVVWEDTSVEWWYRQNTLLYVRKDQLGRYPRLQAIAAGPQWPRRVVHPIQFEVMGRRPSRLTTTMSAVRRAFGRRVLRPAFDRPASTLGPTLGPGTP
ncbi:MAG TPA: class I SAM-dependent methyltransferase [Alphaproteobacteria bacterium]|jgi:SAM-dependent methyltransferase|nr:class I SAM-dependent methyltransferase [Alphaproteobacteria bacterium]